LRRPSGTKRVIPGRGDSGSGGGVSGGTNNDIDNDSTPSTSSRAARAMPDLEEFPIPGGELERKDERTSSPSSLDMGERLNIIDAAISGKRVGHHVSPRYIAVKHTS
jgi:hypothetical protein